MRILKTAIKTNGTDNGVRGDEHNLPNFTFLLNTHSYLATNKQILLKDEIKH